jgi:hypothetical protein
MMQVFRLHALDGGQFFQAANRKGSLTVGTTQVHFLLLSDALSIADFNQMALFFFD